MAFLTDLEAVRLMQRCVILTKELELALLEYSALPTRAVALDIVKEPRIENRLVELAAETRPLARSWRNFDVGTACISIRGSSGASKIPWYVRFAANTKEEGGEKYCGEQRLFDAALRKRVRHIVILGVVGKPQQDHGSGRKGITLETCERCRWRARGLMREKSPVLEPDTIVVSAHCDMLWARKRQTFADLHDAHGEPMD